MRSSTRCSAPRRSATSAAISPIPTSAGGAPRGWTSWAAPSPSCGRPDFGPVNVDAVVIVERPRIAAYVPEVRVNLARALGLDAASVSVKGKTNEGVGEVGRGEAIACHAVALVVES